MAKKRTRKPENDFDKLARLIKQESDDTRGEIRRLDKRIDGLNKRFDGVDEQLREIRSELADIHRRIERLEEQGANQAGYAKEIDHLLQRVAVIEKHLGLKLKQPTRK